VNDETAAPDAREIGRVVGDRPGPTLIAVAGIHGNERAGVGATRRVLATLARRNGVVRGELLALAGNVGAMRLGQRYRVRDMNRVWTAARIRDLEERAGLGGPLDEEDVEQLELLAAIRGAIARARGPVFLIDLHTTSAHGLPFVLFGDTLRQRRFASPIPLPLVMGLEEQLDGILASYWTTQGVITCGVEGGQHDDPATIDNLEAVLLLAAESAGVFGTALLSETGAAHALLERRRGSLPHVIEVVARHPITPLDQFVMEPGFQNLAPVPQNKLLARDVRGEIRAPKDGFVLLPLYQGQGDDGFFWGREAGPARLRISEALRRINADRLLSLLPGIRRDPATPSRIVIDERSAGLYSFDKMGATRTGMFHILGYRRIRKNGAAVTLERQPEIVAR
jgi:succinylglutamate desuccinylase